MTPGTHLNEILFKVPIFSFETMRLKMSFAKCQPFCSGQNELHVNDHTLQGYLTVVLISFQET